MSAKHKRNSSTFGWCKLLAVLHNRLIQRESSQACVKHDSLGAIGLAEAAWLSANLRIVCVFRSESASFADSWAHAEPFTSKATIALPGQCPASRKVSETPSTLENGHGSGRQSITTKVSIQKRKWHEIATTNFDNELLKTQQWTNFNTRICGKLLRLSPPKALQ